MITHEIEEYIERSVLCWLATSSSDNIPNVSPKEVFTKYDSDSMIIANIASPQSVKNIKENENVCLSFLDILVQKGFQLKGRARIIGKSHEEYNNMNKKLEQITQGKYPFSTITHITINQSKKIIAPSYILYPETSEESQIANAKKVYGLKS